MLNIILFWVFNLINLTILFLSQFSSVFSFLYQANLILKKGKNRIMKKEMHVETYYSLLIYLVNYSKN